ncbi:hypothetical protein HYU91_00155 [Candidatus Collierbacteria bacterium]|nr:hypothetical protein [Candidatus Collierbacteria bacterium]
MPDSFERFRNWSREVLSSDFQQSAHRRVEAQNTRLARAGIFLRKGFNDLTLSTYLETLSNHDLFCLGKMITDPGQQEWFFGSAYGYVDAVETARALGELLKNSTDQLTQINLAISEFVKICKNPERYSNRFNRYVHVIGVIVKDKRLYSIFGGNPANIAEKIKKIFGSFIGDPRNTIDSFRAFLDNPTWTVESAKSLLELPIEDLKLILRHQDVFGKHPEAVEVYESFRGSSQNWGDRYLLFRNLCLTVGGLPLNTTSLSKLLIKQMSPEAKARYNQRDPAGKFLTIGAIRKRLGYDALREISLSKRDLLQSDVREQSLLAKKIAQDENTDLPIITMGIAATQGNEIEYPSNPETMTAAIPEGFAVVTETLGIHWGGGGDGCAEIAPGPFYHPETMVAFVRLMQDLGLIDFYKYKGMTLHFNPGIGKKGLKHLILAQYLGNTMSATSMFSSSSREYYGFSFQVYGDQSGSIDTYTECKSFLCVTPAETELGLTQVGYLSWALKCHQRVGEYLVDYRSSPFTPEEIGKTNLPDQVKRMAIVWSKYAADLDEGVAFVGLDKLFYRDDYDDNVSSEKLNRMIALIDEIVPDYQARYKNPNLVITLNPVVVRGRRWPNVVAFARSISNEAVRKIKSIEQDINIQAKQDIRKIDEAAGTVRVHKIHAFVGKYRPNSKELTLEEKMQAVKSTAKALGITTSF